MSYVLATAEAKSFFLQLLATHKDEHGIEIYSYSVMDTHPHVQLRATRGQAAFSRFWKIVNYRFARWWNKRRGSCGQVVMQRMSSPQVQEGRHQLAVMRYGDLNPVRAGIVRSAKDWCWSSYRHYAFGEPNPLVTDAPEYLALGHSGTQRRRAYVHLLATKLRTGRSRLDFVTAPFIGDDQWVAARRCEIQHRDADPP